MHATCQHLNIEGNRYVLLRESEYERICREAGRAADVPEDELPPLPEPDEQGNVPAVEYSRLSIGRDLLRQRRAAGLPQQRLADLACARQETVSRIESGRHSVTVRTCDKIFNALEAAASSGDTSRATKSKGR